MATSKTFETIFSILGKYQAGPAFDKTNKDLTRTEKNVHGTTVSFGKMWAAVAAGVASIQLASKAWHAFTGAIEKSFDAAMDVQKRHEALKVSVERNWSRYKAFGMTVDKVTQSLIDLAEAQEKTKFDAEDMEAGYAKLMDTLSPKQIKEFADSFGDMIAKLKGADATKDDIEDLAAQVDKLMVGGKSSILKQLMATPAEAKAIKEATTSYEKMVLLKKVIARVAPDEAKRIFSETTAGRIRQMNIQAGNLAETFGKPLTEPVGKLADAFKEVYIALGPVVEELANRLTPIIQDLTKFIMENKDSIVGWVSYLGGGLITSIQDTSKQIIALHDLWKTVWAETTDLWNTLTTNLTSGASKAWEGIQSMWGSLPKWFDENIVQPIIKLWEKLVGFLSPMWERITGKPLQGTSTMTPSETTAAAQSLATGYPTAAAAPTATSEAGRQAQELMSKGGYGSGSAAAHEAASTGALAQMPATNKDIAAERARVIAQLKEPGVRELVAATIAHEQGGAEGRADVLESLVNRSVVTGKSPRQLIEGGGRKGSFYGPYRRGEVQATLAKGVSPGLLKEYDAAEAAIAAGRNRIQGRTDQGMVNEIKEQYGRKINVAGEYYGFMGNKGEKATAAYRASLPGYQPPTSTLAPGPLAPTVPTGSKLKDMIKDINVQQRVGGATGGTNVASNPVINIHGVPTGQEGAVGQEVKAAMQNPTKKMLSDIKSARSYEARLGYV